MRYGVFLFIRFSHRCSSVLSRLLDHPRHFSLSTCCFLGLQLDDKLSFKNHINFIVSKINSLNGMLYRRRDYIPLNCRRNLCFALVHPRIQYGIEIHGKTTLKLLQPLHISCNRVLRTLQGQSRFCNMTQLYIN